MITPAFPLTAPFRIDQFMVAPQAMTALFFVQGGLAIAIHWAGVQGRTKLWRAAVACGCGAAAAVDSGVLHPG